MKNKVCTLRLPASVDPRGIWRKAAGSHTCEPIEETVQIRTFYDTFDWRLFNRDLVLLKERDRYLLYSLPNRETVASVSLPREADPVYSTDFPEGPMKGVLQAHLSVRALLPLAKARTRRQTMRVLNRNEKTVLIATIEQARVMDAVHTGQSLSTVMLNPVRGYEKHARRLRRFLRDAGAEPQTEDLFHVAMRATGREPADYTSKFNVVLEPDLNGAEAARRILGCLFRTIRRNEAGIKEDVDTEFLHDFRVGIRRTRSALSQIKSVFPEVPLRRFRKDFSWLGKLTNRMRDLDVALLKRDTYGLLLPGYLRPRLDPLFESMRDERTGEHRRLAAALDGDRYRKIAAEWEAFLEGPPESDAPDNAEAPAMGLAQGFIDKRYRRVVEMGAAIEASTPDADLHRLRIECKKLRYLLEFFSSLFPPGEIRLIVGHLKSLQDNLGDFNDLSVQQADLKEYLRTLSAERTHPEAFAAIGGLIGCLYREQQTVRGAFSKTFTEFNRAEVAATFRRLSG
ncbi:MAG: CHAD domain-containing protein [Gemmatimonadota bacterium]|nr:CHAD domain-containing protein [Gemmatimonadota bacterium]